MHHYVTGQEHARAGQTDHYTGGFMIGMTEGGKKAMNNPNHPKPDPTSADNIYTFFASAHAFRPTAQLPMGSRI